MLKSAKAPTSSYMSLSILHFTSIFKSLHFSQSILKQTKTGGIAFFPCLLLLSELSLCVFECTKTLLVDRLCLYFYLTVCFFLLNISYTELNETVTLKP